MTTLLQGTCFDPALLVPGHVLRAFHPINEGEGVDFYRDRLLTPLYGAFEGLEVRTDIHIAGRFADAQWTSSSGHLAGAFVAPLFGISPSGRAAWLRFGRFDRLANGAKPGAPCSVVETLLLIDLPQLMIEGRCWPLGAPLGAQVIAPGPVTHDGLAPGDDAGEAQASLTLVEAMLAGLRRYDGQDLRSMDMRSYWTDRFWWYGPAPIGSFQGHAAYEAGHQGPFLRAFPDRVGGNHRARIAQGAFTGSTGWPSMHATHRGGDWLGLAPTGRAVTLRVMDWWARDRDRLSENWVMIDIPELLLQLDIDVFARSRALSG